MAINYGSIIDGASRSDNIDQAGLVLDMEGLTHLLDENSYYFEALTRKIGKVITASRFKHEYRERRLIREFVTLSADSAASATTFTTNDWNRIKANNYLYNTRTGELVLVQTLPTTSTVTITGLASDGSTAHSIAWLSGDILINVGESHADGDEVPAAFSADTIDKYDYIMQKDRRIQTTDQEEAEQHYDSTEKRRMDQRQAWIEYHRDMNLLFYIGQNGRETTSSGSGRRHCCGGLIEKITENVTDFTKVNGGFTLESLAGMLADTHYHSQSSDRKFGLFGVNAWKAISSWPRDALKTNPNETKWGIRVDTIITGFGDIDVAYDNQLNARLGLDGQAFVLDTQHIRQIQMQKLPIRIIENIPNLSGVHQNVDAITGTFGLQLLFPELHARAFGIK